MDTEQAAYIAGLVEGEGCIDTNFAGHGQIRVRMSDEDTVLRAHRLVNAGVVYGPLFFNAKPFAKPTWELRVTNTKRRTECTELVRALYPYLLSRRQAKAREVFGEETFADVERSRWN